MATWRDANEGAGRRKKPKSKERNDKDRAGWRAKPNSSSQAKVWSDTRKRGPHIAASKTGAYGLLVAAAAIIALFAYVIIIGPKTPDFLALTTPPGEAVRAGQLQGYTWDSAGSGQGGAQGLSPTSTASSLQDLDQPRGGLSQVLYWSGHGMVVLDEKGQPTPIMIQGLERTPVGNALDFTKGTPTILALDASQGRVRWEEGQLVNLFPDAVQDLVEGASRDDLLVLLPCSSGQQDWSVQPGGPSVFSRQVFEALAGRGGTASGRLRHLGIWQTLRPQRVADALRRGCAHQARIGAELLQTAVSCPAGVADFHFGRPLPPPRPAREDSASALESRLQQWNRLYLDAQIDGAEGWSPLLAARVDYDLAELWVAMHKSDERAYRRFRDAAGRSVSRLKQALSDLGVKLPRVSEEPAVAEWDRLCEDRTLDLFGELNGFASAQARDASPVERRYARLLVDSLDWDAAPNAVVRLALQTRRQSEELASFPDPRVHAALRSELADLEAARRLCDDLMIANRWRGAETNLRELQDNYRSLKGRFEACRNAYRACDKIFDLAPWIGEWWLDEMQLDAFGVERGPAAGDRLATLQRVYAEGAALAKALHDRSSRGVSTAGEVGFDPRDTERLDDSFNSLMKARSPAGDNALQRRHRFRRQTNPVFMSQETSPLFGSSSADVLDKASPTAAAAGSADRGDAASHADRGRQYVDQVRQLVASSRHPVSWMLAADLSSEEDAGATPVQQFAGVGGKVRAAVHAAAEQSCAVTEEELPLADLAQPSLDSRRTAWLTVRTKQLEDLPTVDHFWARCRREQNEWLARRSINDFWGDGSPEGPYYFEAVADRCGLPEDDAQLRAAVVAARSLDAAADLPGEGPVSQDPERARVRVSLSMSRSDLLPEPGQAAFFLAGDDETLSISAQGSRNSARRLPIPFANSSPEPRAVTVRGAAGSPLPSRAVWQLCYRGHRKSKPLRLAPERIDWRQVSHKPYTDAELGPRVTVHGDDRRRVDVVFVLDASASMKKKEAGEGKGRSRLEIAKAIIASLLNTIRREGDERFWVSLIAYGHRYNYDYDYLNDDNDGTLTGGARTNPGVDPRWVDPKKKHPAGDVQIINQGWRVPRRAGAVQEWLRSNLNPINPYGQTPLYLAISRGLDCFNDANADRHLIVLTDGENDVRPEYWNYPKIRALGSEWEFEDYATSAVLLGELREQPKRLQPKITVFSYGFKAEQGLRAIATVNGQGGAVYDVSTAAKLNQQLNSWLEETLKSPKFSVARRGGGAEAGGGVDFGNSWEPAGSWAGSRQGLYSIDTQGLAIDKAPSATVRLDGWENLHLELDKRSGASPWRLVHRTYESLRASKRYSDRRFGLMRVKRAAGATGPSEGMTAHSVRYSAHPNPVLGSKTFDVALERGDRARQTLAPKHVWAEITPVAGERALTPYRACDIKCLVGRNIPVLSWRADDWPAEAKSGRVRLWLAFDDDGLDTETHRIDPRRIEQAFALEDGTSWRAVWVGSGDGSQGLRLRLTTAGEHAIGTSVHLSSETAEVVRTERRFAEGQKNRRPVAEHDFWLSAKPDRPIAIRFLAVESLKRQGWSFGAERVQRIGDALPYDLSD